MTIRVSNDLALTNLVGGTKIKAVDEPPQIVLSTKVRPVAIHQYQLHQRSQRFQPPVQLLILLQIQQIQSFLKTQPLAKI